MEHRADVSHVMRDRFAEMVDGNVEYERINRHYEEYLRPSDEKMKLSLSGATSIDLSACFDIHKRLFSRDASTTDSNLLAKDDVVINLSLDFIHTSNACGYKPVDLSGAYSPQLHPMTSILLKVLVHCPPAYNAVLKAYDRPRSEYLKKLLHFVH